MKKQSERFSCSLNLKHLQIIDVNNDSVAMKAALMANLEY